jgi:hypothetical protein
MFTFCGSYSGFQLDEVHARNPVSLRNRVSQYLTHRKNAIGQEGGIGGVPAVLIPIDFAYYLLWGGLLYTP